MAQNLLPQSALPIGQTPLQTIQAPRVQVNIPNPLDVSSFFKMQQGQQNNLGILQRNEQLKLQRQELDLRKYETMVREMESIMNLANNGFGEFYDNKAQQRSANKSTGVDAFSNLNPFYAKHAEIIDRNQGIYDSAQKKLDEMGMSFLTSGSTDPAARFEVSRGMNNVITDTMRQVKRDPEYVKYSTMHMAYNKWLDEINKRKNNGDYVDVRAVDEMEAKYTAWANGDDSVGEMSLSQFNPDKYVFKADVLKDMAADSKLLSTGVEQFEEIETTGGGVLAGKKTTKRSLDEITNELYDKYSTDPNARAIYRNIYDGKKKEDDTPYTMKDWVRDLARPYAPKEGLEVTEVAEPGSPLIKPGDGKAVSDSKEGTGSSYSKLFGDEPKTEDERMRKAVMDEIDGMGFDAAEVGRLPYLKINDSEDIERLKFKYYGTVDGEEVEVDRKDPRANRLEVILEGGFYDEDGNKVEDKIISTHGKRKDLENSIGRTDSGKVPAGLLPINQEWFEREGLNYRIKGESSYISSQTLDVLKSLPSKFNTDKVILSSIFRDEYENKNANGHPNSDHLFGDAIDFSYSTQEGRELGRWALSDEGKAKLKEAGYFADEHDKGSGLHLHIAPINPMGREAKDDPRYHPVNPKTGKPEDLTVRSHYEAAGNEQYGEGTAKAMEFADQKMSMYIMDKLLAGENVDNAELNHIRNNPPKGYGETILNVNRKINEGIKEMDEMEALLAKKSVVSLKDSESKRLEELKGKYQSQEDPQGREAFLIRQSLNDAIIANRKDDLLRDMVRYDLVDEIAEEIDIPLSGSTKGIKITPIIDPSTGQKNPVYPFLVSTSKVNTKSSAPGYAPGSKIPVAGDPVPMKKEDLIKLLQDNVQYMDNETKDKLFDKEMVAYNIQLQARNNVKKTHDNIDKGKQAMIEETRKELEDKNKQPKVNSSYDYFINNK